MPLLILVCILGGFTTPTEASILAVIYSIIVGLFIYKDLTIKMLPKILKDSAITTAAILNINRTSKCICMDFINGTNTSISC